MNEHDFNRLETQNRQIRRIVDPEEQKRLDDLNEPLEDTGGKIALTAVVLVLCGVLVFLFWAMCKTVLQGMPQ